MSVLTIKEVAERLKVAPATVYTLCAQRKLGHVRVGARRGTIRIPEEALENYLRGQTVQPAKPAAPMPKVRLKHLKP